jgi:hypothetical protein
MHKEIQNGVVAKSCMKKGLLIYEEMCKWGGRLSYVTLQLFHSDFLIFEENLIYFLSVQNTPYITLGNEQYLKLLLGICNTKKRGDLSLPLGEIHPPSHDHNPFLGLPNKMFKTS